AVAGPDVAEVPGPKAAGRALQGVGGAAGGALEDDLDGARLRGPDAEPGALALGPGTQRRLPAHGTLLPAGRLGSLSPSLPRGACRRKRRTAPGATAAVKPGVPARDPPASLAGTPGS